MSNNSRSITVFATIEDWAYIFAEIEEEVRLAFILGGRQSMPIRCMDSFHAIENLESFRSDNDRFGRSYLCMFRDSEYCVRYVDLRDGQRVAIVDQLSCPDSVAIRIGSVEETEKIIVSGQIGTASKTKKSTGLFDQIQKATRSKFTRIKSSFVGPQARQLFEEGWRLTGDYNAPRIFDLKK